MSRDCIDEDGRDYSGFVGFREEVVRVAVQNHAPDRRNRHQFFRHDLGGVEHIEAEAVGLLLGEYLHPQLPLREFAGHCGEAREYRRSLAFLGERRGTAVPGERGRRPILIPLTKAVCSLTNACVWCGSAPTGLLLPGKSD